MSLVEFLFAPRLDHRGWSTPSEASRIYFIIVMVFTIIYSWNLANSNFIVFLCLTMLISTPILSLGWWIISIIGNGMKPKLLVESVSRVDKSKKIPLHSFRKP